MVAVVVAVAVMATPVVSVSPDAANPADVESKAGTIEVDDLLAPGDAPIDLGAVAVLELGAHGPTFSAVGVPFLEVPEDPPEAR